MKKIFGSFILISSLLAGCGDNEFSGATQEQQQEVEPSSVRFVRDVDTSADVDMVWVIDNSVSMAEEIQIIRENLGQFLLSLEERARLNFTLITNNKGKNGMALSSWALNRGYRQIPQEIDSYDSLTRFVELLPSMYGTSLRLNSKKVVVVVTDDNSELSANRFMQSVAGLFALSQVRMFGFVGLSTAQSPCIDRVGTHYISLAQATGGRAFNICETDWRPYFNTLIKDVGQLAKTEFTLPSKPKGKITVKIDGVVTKAFSLNGVNLVVHPSNFPQNKKYNIDVIY